MKLVADRFVVYRDGNTVDLATGLRVWLRVSAADTASDVRWSAQCDMFVRLQHQAIAPLLDYGALGRHERFEAWQCGPPWNGANVAARAVRRSVTAFLRASRLGAVDPAGDVRVRNGAPVIVPAMQEQGGTPSAVPAFAAMPMDMRGLMSIDAAPLAALAEMFRAIAGPRLQAAAVWGPSGAGKSWLVRQLARLARINGFVPVSIRRFAGAERTLWLGRSLFLIDDGSGAGSASAIDAAIASPLPHALLMTGEHEVPGIAGVALRPFLPDRLVDGICPREMTPAIERDVRRAAERACGWPGRFARTLWPTLAGRTSADLATSTRVAEQTEVYGGDERVGSPPAAQAPATWPAPGELAALRQRATDGLRQLSAGQHARGIRALRAAAAGLARRDSWNDAANVGLDLARAMRRRGQVREAAAVVDRVRDHATRAGSVVLLLDASVIAGEMWIDRARLDEAEAVLSTAVTSAATIDDRECGARAGLALARCLFWRGRYDEAFAAADRAGAVAEDLRIRRQRRLAIIAAARGDLPRALRSALDLLATTRDSDAATQAAVLHTAALVHLASGDAPSAAGRAADAVRAARRSHDPLRAVGARIVLIEAERRSGATLSASPQHLARLLRALPALLQAQAAPAEHRRSLPPLSLLLVADTASVPPVLPMVDHVIAIVQACQSAEDEIQVLHDVCGRIRQQLHAASVAVAAGVPSQLTFLAADGAGADLDIARRAMDAGILVAPHRHEDRIVGAAAIHYGGTTIGALAARWPLGSTSEQSHAGAVLTTAAVAAAPIVSAALARRERITATSGRELLGSTSAMDQVRRLIDRAATAPFPVLIDGESGSGKELIAQAIHRGSPRRERAFRTLNCAAIPDDLAEAELFGHVRGSFTGAIGERAGVFEDAHGGTLFLDEVGELTPRAQAKLLRVLQEGEVRRVGENVSRRVDVRIVAATNRDLRAESEAGRFRVDLLYRLDVIRISMPALRERAEDVPMLAEHFWREATGRINSRATLATSTIAALARYHWPGNVRELQNVLAALAVRCPKRGVVPPSALPPPLVAPAGSPAWRLEEARRVFEERFVRAALARSGGHRARAAADLGVSRQGLTKLMARLGIS